MRWLASTVFVLGCHHGTVDTPSPCHAVADHVQALLAVGERAHDAIYKRCVDDAWPREVLTCMLTETLRDNHHCKQLLPGAAREALDRDLAATLRPDPPESCKRYRDVYRRIRTCDQLADEPRARITDEFRKVTTELEAPDADSSVLAFTCLVGIQTAQELAGPTCGL